MMPRRLKCRIKRQCSEALLSGQAKRTTIAELFSPPGVVLEAVRRGGVSHGSYDLTTGYDMQVPSVRQEVRARLERDSPDVLIASPPYPEEGTWSRDNWSKVGDWRREAALLWSFTCLCMQDQLARGGTVLLEHPGASWTWRLPSTRQLFKSCMCVRGDACALGRMSERPMKEMTGWLTNSYELARALLRLRPGDQGDELMDAVLSAVGLERNNQEVSLEEVYALEEADNEAEPENVLEHGSDDDDTEKKTKRRRVLKRPVEQVLRESGRSLMESALRRLHVNLGHSSTNELVRILKHSGATEAAIASARQFSCDVCHENTRPTSARPANPTEVTIFNERLGVDQFEILGLRHLEKRKMLNAGVESFSSLCHDQLRDLHPDFFERRWLGTDERVVHMRYHTCFERLMHKQTSLLFATFGTHVLCEYTSQEFCKVTACRSSLHVVSRFIHHVLVLSEVERTFHRMSLLA